MVDFAQRFDTGRLLKPGDVVLCVLNRMNNDQLWAIPLNVRIAFPDETGVSAPPGVPKSGPVVAITMNTTETERWLAALFDAKHGEAAANMIADRTVVGLQAASLVNPLRFVQAGEDEMRLFQDLKEGRSTNPIHVMAFSMPWPVPNA